jgi:hypothetical protein
VAHPENDFGALANKELGKLKAKGMRMVRSIDPLG